MISKGIPFQLAVLVGVLFVVAGAPCFASVRHPRRSAEAYVRAVQMQKRLEAQPVRERTIAEYKRVINEFRSVYWYDFANLKAPVAAEAMGDLYAQMGRAFSNPRYFQDAIKAYNYVISQYPVTSMALDSVISVGKVYLEDLHDPNRAAEIFRSFLKKHSSTPQANEARRNLKEISEVLAERKERNSTSSESASENGKPARPVEIRGIHGWAGPNSTRLVIEARGAFKYSTFRLDHPDRIVFDLPNTYLSRPLLGKVIPINDDFLENVRVAQFTPRITRIVLDLKNFENYSAFSLANPFRLIIDVHGKSTGKVIESADREANTLTATTKPTGTIRVPTRRNVPAAKSLRVSRTSPEAEATKQPRRSERRKTEAASLDIKVPVAKRAEIITSRASKAAHHASNKERNTEVASIRKKPDEIPISIKPASPTANGSETLTRALGLKVTRIVIDPGHGGFDTGAIGPRGLEEKNVALSIALRLRKLLETRTDYRVFMTRTTDKFIPLEERTAIANADHADLFVSIHANASTDHRVRGIATYFLNFTTDSQALKVAARENATSQDSVYQLKSLIKKIALNNKIEESQQLARDIQTALCTRMHRISHGIQNRGVQKAPFVVLIGANMPSVLVETGFITNPRTEHLLREPSYREQIAKGIYHGIQDYINNLGSFRVAQRTR